MSLWLPGRPPCDCNDWCENPRTSNQQHDVRMQVMFLYRGKHREHETWLLKRSKGGQWKVYWAEEINSDLGGGWEKPQMETISLFWNRTEPTKRPTVNIQLNKLIIEQEKINERGFRVVEQWLLNKAEPEEDKQAIVRLWTMPLYQKLILNTGFYINSPFQTISSTHSTWVAETYCNHDLDGKSFLITSPVLSH